MPDVDYSAAVSNVVVMRPDNRLRMLRKAAKLTQVQLAERTGVSQPTISQIENGLLAMDTQWLKTFGRVLNCSPADLLPDEWVPDRLDADQRARLALTEGLTPAELEMVRKFREAIHPTEADDEGAATAA